MEKACINIANLGNYSYIHFIIEDMQNWVSYEAK